ncbi:hypothetical protein GCM10025870_19400 [Agromyces marinus]|uniref:Molybdopterin-binding oxidoreductase n=1 Tax=Agromyces marinus TaxID=1389020 RepID=A0ABN6YBX0_9MICO|nr:hypothetical protein GCM10025870_19400 [Agromyces marinus]
MKRMSRRTRAGTAWAAVAGVVGAGVFLAVTWAVGLFGPPGSDPILAVGAFVIDITPQPLKEFAIATFGFYDKIVLIAALIVAAIAGAAIAGILQFRRPPWGVVLLAVAVGASIAAILTRGGATPSPQFRRSSAVPRVRRARAARRAAPPLAVRNGCHGHRCADRRRAHARPPLLLRHVRGRRRLGGGRRRRRARGGGRPLVDHGDPASAPTSGTRGDRHGARGR